MIVGCLQGLLNWNWKHEQMKTLLPCCQQLPEMYFPMVGLEGWIVLVAKWMLYSVNQCS